MLIFSFIIFNWIFCYFVKCTWIIFDPSFDSNFVDEVELYSAFNDLSSSIRALFWFSSTATLVSRHFMYSFFFLRHSRAASRFFIKRISRLRLPPPPRMPTVLFPLPAPLWLSSRLCAKIPWLVREIYILIWIIISSIKIYITKNLN